MKYTGKIAGVQTDFRDGKTNIILAVNERPAALDRYQGKEIEISITEKGKKRSLDANAYYWVLLGKLADALRISKPYLHNELLRCGGQFHLYGDRPVYVVLPDDDETRKKVDEDEILHLYPTSETREGRDGTIYRTYMLLKGSHELNSKEMSILLNGLIEECRNQGIETATPEELKRMVDLYEKRHPAG